MKITVTVNDVFEKGCWDEFCELKGLSVWAANDGQVGPYEEFTLSEAEAKNLGFLRKTLDDYLEESNEY